MGKYFFSYDLNGKSPTHAEMDRHIRALFGATVHRVLETVWFIRTGLTEQQLYAYLNQKLSANDRILVIEATDAMMRNLLVPSYLIQNAWVDAPSLPAAHRPPVTAPRALGLGRR